MDSLKRFLDFFRIAFQSIRQRKTRSWLTMIGIFIGIGAVVALVSLGQGLQDAINVEFEGLGMDKIFISPGGAFMGVGGVDSLSEDDISLLKKNKDILLVSNYFFSTAKISWADEQRWYAIIGFPTEKEDMDLLDELFTVEEGRWFKKGEKYKAIIGYDYANSPAFEKHLTIGDKFLINEDQFKVIGIFEKKRK